MTKNIFKAIAQDKLEAVEAFIKDKTNHSVVNEQGLSLLEHAAVLGKIDSFKLLVKEGFKVRLNTLNLALDNHHGAMIVEIIENHLNQKHVDSLKSIFDDTRFLALSISHQSLISATVLKKLQNCEGLFREVFQKIFKGQFNIGHIIQTLCEQGFYESLEKVYRHYEKASLNAGFVAALKNLDLKKLSSMSQVDCWFLLAGITGQFPVIKTLCSNNRIFSLRPYTIVLKLAAGHLHDLSTVKLLLEHNMLGAEAIALKAAAKHGHLDVIQYIIARDEALKRPELMLEDKKAALSLAIEHQHVAVVEFIYPKLPVTEESLLPGLLEFAISTFEHNGNEMMLELSPTIDYLIEQFTVEDAGYAANLAAKAGYVPVIQCMIYNLLINARNCNDVFLKGYDNLGVTKCLENNFEQITEESDHAALMNACKTANVEMVDYLLLECTQPEYGNSIRTPLVEACCKGNIEIIKLLLKHGAQLETMSLAGRMEPDPKLSQRLLSAKPVYAIAQKILLDIERIEDTPYGLGKIKKQKITVLDQLATQILKAHDESKIADIIKQWKDEKTVGGQTNMQICQQHRRTSRDYGFFGQVVDWVNHFITTKSAELLMEIEKEAPRVSM